MHKLAATTFVQAVESPTLAIMVPLLLRGLRERVTAVRRKAAVITDNMAKLVDNPLDAAVFLPRLLPVLSGGSTSINAVLVHLAPAADGAAVDIMRRVLNTIPMDGVIVIGEGESDFHWSG